MDSSLNHQTVGRADKYITAAAPLLLALVILILFWPAVHFDFLNIDDPVYVRDNPIVNAGIKLPAVKTAFLAVEDEYWAPVLLLSFMADTQIFGSGPQGYHFTNVLLHAINTVLFFLLLRTVTGSLPASLLTAMLWAVHPLRVEAVAWISQRKDVLSTLFFLACLIAYLSYGRSLRFRWFGLSVLFFVLGLATKPMLVTVPFLLLLLDIWPLGRIGIPESPLRNWWAKVKRPVLEKLAIVPFSLLFAGLTVYTQKTGLYSIDHPFSLLGRVMRALSSYLIYIKKLLWPSGLGFRFYYESEVEVLFLDAGLFSLLILFVVTVWAIKRYTSTPWFFTGWGWYLISLVPVSGVVAVGSQWLSDRFTYLPHLGIFMVLACYISRSLEKPSVRKPAIAIMLMVTAAFIPLTMKQIQYWRSPVALFTRSVALEPESAKAQANLGRAYYMEDELDKAEQHLYRALARKPRDFKTRLSLAALLVDLGKPEKALEQFKPLLDYTNRKDQLHLVHNDIGDIYMNLGRTVDAIRHFRKAISIREDYADAHYNLGLALSADNHLEEAAAQFGLAVRHNPWDIQARLNLAEQLIILGKDGDAIRMLAETIRIAHGTPESYYARGRTLELEGDMEGAVKAYRQGLVRVTDDTEMTNALRNSIDRIETPLKR